MADSTEKRIAEIEGRLDKIEKLVEAGVAPGYRNLQWLISELRAALAELRAVDMAFGNPTALSECKTRFDKICKMFREIEASHTAKRAAEADRDRLRDDLRKFGRHLSDCGTIVTFHADGRISQESAPGCTCGFDAALGASPKGKAP